MPHDGPAGARQAGLLSLRLQPLANQAPEQAAAHGQPRAERDWAYPAWPHDNPYYPPADAGGYAIRMPAALAMMVNVSDVACLGLVEDPVVTALMLALLREKGRGNRSRETSDPERGIQWHAVRSSDRHTCNQFARLAVGSGTA